MAVGAAGCGFVPTSQVVDCDDSCNEAIAVKGTTTE